jgi:hypothetical protein
MDNSREFLAFEKAFSGISSDVGFSKGGPGSGNFNHHGRPGEVGGSGPGADANGIPESGPKGPSAPDSSMKAAADQSAKSLLERAKAVEPAVTEAVKKATAVAGGKLEGLDFRLKTNAARVSEKIQEEMVEKNLTSEEAAKNIGDTVRYTTILPPDKYTEGVQASVAKLKESGIEPFDHKQKNYWPPPPGAYHGLNYIFTDKSGHKIEMQYHTADSFKTKMDNHLDYEKARSSTTDKSTRDQLNEKMLKTWAKVEVPKNVHTLGVRVPNK